jgi:hypothetical protein
MSPREFGEIFNDMRKHRLKWMRSYVRVLEPQTRGTPHYHLAVATPFDLKPAEFDWDALYGAAEARKKGDVASARLLTKQYAQKAPPELRECWGELRDLCEHYGLGRSEMLPFRKEAGAVANYIGKYLEAGVCYRRDDWKGARRVEFDRSESSLWRSCASSFAWVSPRASSWRTRVGELAAAVCASDTDDLVRILGRKWAYHARPCIITAPEEEWRFLLAYYALQYGGKMERKHKLTIGGKVLEWWPGLEEVASTIVYAFPALATPPTQRTYAEVVALESQQLEADLSALDEDGESVDCTRVWNDGRVEKMVS